MFRSLSSLPNVIGCILVLVGNLAGAQLQPGSAAAQTDWIQRVTESSVLYATNFDQVYLDGVLDATRSGISSNSDLINEAQEPPPNSNNIGLNSNFVLSGASSLQLTTPGSSGASGGGSWAFRPDGRSGSARNDLYVQFSVYYPKETIGYRFDHNGDSYLKTINFGQYGAGQVVVGDAAFSGYPILLINGTQTLGNYNHFYSSSDTPWGIATTRENPAIDNGANLNASNSKEEWLNNYGVMPRGVASQDGDYSYNGSSPYLYQRNMPNGWPDSRAAESGAVPWQRDGWTTIEAHLIYDESGDSTIQIWAAPYGEAATLIVNETGTAPLNSNSNNSWSRIELLNYATGRNPEASRPTQFTYYDEVIVSTSPIQFPGGHEVPSTFENNGGGSGGAGSGSGGSTTDLSTRDAPTWVRNIEPGTWQAISFNTLEDVDPQDDPDVNPNYPDTAPWRAGTGQRAVIDAWNGGAFADGYGEHGGLIVYGGGHNDYYGSELYAFDMESRRWVRVTDPYPGPYNFPYSNGVYPDGSPVPPHTYSMSAYDPETNSYIQVGGVTTLGPSALREYKIDVVHMFSFDTMTWRRSKHAPSPRPNFQGGGWAVFDSLRNQIWAEGGTASEKMGAFSPSGDNGDGTYGSWEGAYTLKTAVTDTVAEYDPRNDIVVLLPWRGDSRIAAVDLSSPDQNDKFLNVSGNGPSIQSKTGFSWSDSNQAFLQIGHSGDSVYRLRHTSGDWDNGMWQWDQLTSPSNNVNPGSAANGVYDRFQIVSYQDAEVAIVVKSIDGPVYAFRVPPAVSPKPNTNMEVE